MTRWAPSAKNWPSLYNTPLECGLRSVVILLEIFPQRVDLQRLVQYDYLLVHSADVPNGPSSIHPATPNRAGEMLVRRPIIENGIQMMMTKSLIECEFSSEGIRYYAGEWAVTFIGRLESRYTAELRMRAEWAARRFEDYSDDRLNQFMRDNWAVWGAEFEFSDLCRSQNI